MTVREFLMVLRRRWFVVAVSVLLAIGGAAIITLSTPRVYTATATVYLSATPVSSGTSSGSTPDPGPVVISQTDINTFLQSLSSPVFLDPLKKQLGVQPGEWVSVSGGLANNTALLDLTATASSPTLAADAANLAGPQLAKVALEYSTLLSQSASQVTSRTMTPATPPSTPTSPNLRTNLALGALVGLLLGIGMAFVAQLADTKVRRDEDLADITAAPVLAHLPLDKHALARPLISDDRHGMLAEAFRRLRTNLLFVDVTTAQHSVVVTSAMPGEGKTTTSVNLALALADTGSRVLLIDGDLRNPSVGKATSLDSSVGLTTVLLGRIEVADAIQRFPGSDLDILTAGQIPPNPTELIGSVPMEMLYHDLKSRYDFIVIDSPPVVPVVDAVLLEKIAGNLLLVVAADRTSKKDVQSAIRQLDSTSGRVSGIAVNMVTGALAAPYRYGYHRPEELEGATASLGESEPRRRDLRRH